MKTNEPVYVGDALAAKLGDLPQWTASDGWLRREYGTDGWRVTMLVVNAIAFLAEAANHHPDLEVHWGRVIIRLQTHSAGGVTDKDIELAHRIEALVLWRPDGGFPGLSGPSGAWISG